MKTKILTSILLSVLVTCFVFTGLAAAANGNGAGLERVPVFIGFRQTPGPSEQALVRAHGGAIKYSYTLVPAVAASIPEPAIQGLMRNPNVTYIEPVLKVYAVAQTVPWGVERIGAGIVHTGGNNGAGVKVAIIDSGIDYNHPDLDDNYKVGGKDFVNDDDDPMDDAGHGTHVAGTVAAEDNGVGVVGVAPGASLYAYKVLDASGSGDYSDIIAAMQQCVTDGIQVANLSLGSSGDPGETVKAAFDNAEAAGVVIVAAAGNSGNRRGTRDKVIYPARYESCIAVAATDSSDYRAYFSSTGPDVEISAPGVSINSTLLGGGYGYKSGTSMASPHVAGVVALMIKANVADVRTKLQDTADYLGNPLWYGYGLVNAVEAVAGGGGGDSAPTVSIYDPKEGQILNGIYRVLVSASDDGVVELVGLSIDGGAYLDITNNFIGGYYYYDWYTNPNDNGDTHTLQAQATDDAAIAQSTKSTVVNISVDNVDDPPTATIDNPFDGSTVSGVVTVQVDATDAEDAEGDLTVEVSIDSGGWVTADYNFVSGYYEFGWGTTGVSDGTHTIDASASDSSDNTIDATQVTVIVDNSTPPETTMSAFIDYIGLRKMGRNYQATAYVIILDQDDNPVGGATVTADWTSKEVLLDTASSTTDGEGIAVLYSPKIKAQSGDDFTIEITNVVKWPLIYDNDVTIASIDVL